MTNVDIERNLGGSPPRPTADRPLRVVRLLLQLLPVPPGAGASGRRRNRESAALVSAARLLPRELGDAPRLRRTAQRSVRTFVPVVEAIAAAPPADVGHRRGLLRREDVSTAIRTSRASCVAALHDGASDILVTKMMLGAMGCVPAFDTQLQEGLRRLDASARTRCGRSATSTARTPPSSKRIGCRRLDFDTGAAPHGATRRRRSST